MTETEFSRPVRTEIIGEGGMERQIEATAAELTGLKARFGLSGLNALAGRFRLQREAGGIRVEGRVTAEAEQYCAISGAPVPASIDEPVLLRFVADATGGVAADEDVELGAGDLDIMTLDGDIIDLGELTAETLALALPPFPRADEATLAEARRLLMSEEEAEATARAARNPFAALKHKD